MEPGGTERRRTIGGGSPGCTVLIGAIIAGFGLLGMSVLLGGGEVTVNDRPGRPGDAWMPAVFVAIGLGLAGLRHRKTIDLDQRVIETRSGWMLWTRTRRDAIGEWRAVELRPAEERGSGSGRYTAIPVRISGADGVSEIDAPRTEPDARRLAEWLARGAGLPLRDASAGAVIERAPDRLDEPLLARVRDVDLRAPEPQRNRLRVEDQMRGVRIRVPPSSAVFVAPFLALLLPVPLLFWFFFWRPNFGASGDGSLAFLLFRYAPLLLFSIPIIGSLLATARKGAFGYWIEVDGDGIRALGRSIAANELEDLAIVSSGRKSGRGLRARSDRQELRLGAGLHDDELIWLRAAILRALKG